MTEGFETTKNEYFKYPDIKKEEGEFDRVAELFGIESSALMFLAREEGRLVQLSDDIFNRLENTDANTFEAGDWAAVDYHTKPDGVQKRDWESIKKSMEAGVLLNAPIIMKYGDTYHKVSGNTRLMVARAMGVIPTVLLFEAYKE